MWDQIKAIFGLPTSAEQNYDGPEFQLRNFRESSSGLGYIHADVVRGRTGEYVGLASGKTEEDLKEDAKRVIHRAKTREAWRGKTVDL